MLELPPVRFAPFLAIGMLTAYFGGGLLCGSFFAIASAAAVYLAKKRSKALICAAGALWGFVSMSCYMRFYCDPVLDYSGKCVRAEIRVKEVTERSEEGCELIAEINLGGRAANVRLTCGEQLGEGSGAVAVILLGTPDGEKAVQDLANGILLSGEVLDAAFITHNAAGAVEALKSLRAGLAGLLAENCFGERRELALSMLFGMDERLSPRLSESLKVCGAAHYTAVSGAHFAVFAAVLLGMIPENRRRTRTAAALLFAPAAIIFFGPARSVLRASAMFFLYSLSGIFRRKAETLNSLCLSFSLITLFSPGAVLDAGFAMSVLGVFGAGVVGTELSKKLRMLLPEGLHAISPVVGAAAVSISAVICTAPISVALFKGVSLSGALTSLLLIPLMTVAMLFMLILAVTRLSILALPVELSMNAAVSVVGFFGRIRGMWLTMDFEGAWFFAAVCALAFTAAVLGDMKRFAALGQCAAAAVLLSMLLAYSANSNRSEIRFVGYSDSGAAVVFVKNEAVVFISGGGGGLAESVSRCMREHGAVKISCVAAFDADHGGALAIRELSEMMSVGAVYSNEIAKELLRGADIAQFELVPGGRLSVSGVTIAAAEVSDSETNADIVVYSGRITGVPESPANLAVYFSSTEKELPENGVNASRSRDFRIRLDKGGKTVLVID